jgi:hypothetical protein
MPREPKAVGVDAMTCAEYDLETASVLNILTKLPLVIFME